MILNSQQTTSAVGTLAARSRGAVLGFSGLLTLGLSADVHQEVADLRVESAQLKRQNAALVDSLAEANKREKESADALGQIRQRMEALGKNLIDGKDDRMVKAVSDIQVLNQRVNGMEEASMKLSSVIQGYVQTALHADPAERTKVETAIRELDVALGLRNQPVVLLILPVWSVSTVKPVSSFLTSAKPLAPKSG